MPERTVALLDGARSEPRNRLLAALPPAVASTFRAHLRPVPLWRGSVLCEADELQERVYFVEAGAISLVTVFEDGTVAEIATVGCEGMIGISRLLWEEH